MDFNAAAGAGGDDSAAINAAISELTTLGGGALFFPTPPSGAYNICASTINLPLTVSLLMRGASAQTTIRVLPGCGSPPASVLTEGNATGNSYARIRLENLRLDGYCLAAHDLDVGYARGLSAENVVFRNVAPISGDGGSNIRIRNSTQNGTIGQGGWASFELRIGASNLVENVNDSGHSCYSSNTALPSYNLEMWGTDSDFTGLVAVNANLANFYEGAGGGDNHFGENTHGWGTTPPSLQPQYTYWLYGGSTINGAVADHFAVAGVRLSGIGAIVHGLQFYPTSSTLIGVLLDASAKNATITDNQLEWFSPTTQIVQTGGVIDPTNIIQNNTGGVTSAPASAENRIINPDFAIDSYHGGAATTAQAGFFQDRWEIFGSSPQYYQRNPADAFSGCPGALTGLVLVDSGNVAPNAAQNSALIQPIDGADIPDLNMGASTYAQGFEFSFWGYASQAGTYSVAFFNGSWNRSLVATVNLTTTCAYYSLIIPPDNGGTGANGWNATPGQEEMLVGFDLGSGSNYQTSTTGTWQNGIYLEATGSVQLSAVASGQLHVQAVRLRRGVSDIARVPRSINDELRLTRSFRRSTFPATAAPAQNAGVAGALCFKAPSASSYGSLYWTFDAPMRKTPTITTFNPSAANANWRDVTGGSDVTASVDPSSAIGTTGVELTTSGAVSAAGDNVCIHALADVGY